MHLKVCFLFLGYNFVAWLSLFATFHPLKFVKVLLVEKWKRWLIIALRIKSAADYIIAGFLDEFR